MLPTQQWCDPPPAVWPAPCDSHTQPCLPELWLPHLALFPPLAGADNPSPIVQLPRRLQPTLPTAFFIGTSKCGTTTIKVALRQLAAIHESLRQLLFLEGGGSEQHGAQGFYDTLDDWATGTTWARPRPRRRDRDEAELAPPPPQTQSGIHYCPSDLTSLHAMAFVAFALHSAPRSSPPPPIIIMLRDPVDRTLSSVEFKAQSPRAGPSRPHTPLSAYEDVYHVLAVSINNTRARQQCLTRELALDASSSPFWHSWSARSPRRWAVAEQRCSQYLPLSPLIIDYGPHPHLHDHVGNSLYGLAFARLTALLGPAAPPRTVLSLAHLHANPASALAAILRTLDIAGVPSSLVETVAASVSGGPTNARRTPTLSRDSLSLSHPHLLQDLLQVLERDRQMFGREWEEIDEVLAEGGGVVGPWNR